MQTLLLEYRCECNHLLMKGLVSAGSRMQIKCKNCKRLVFLTGEIERDHIQGHFTVLFDKNAKVLDASSSVIDVLGYSREEMRDMTLFDFAPWAKLEYFINMQGVIERYSEYAFSADSMLRSKSGENVFVRTKFKLYKDKYGSKIIAFYRLQEDPSQTSKKEFNTKGLKIFNYVSEINLNGIILYISRDFAGLLNKVNYDLMGTNFFDLLGEKTRKVFLEDLRSNLNPQNNFMLPNVKLSGLEQPFNLCFVPLYHPDNHIKGFKIVVCNQHNCAH